MFFELRDIKEVKKFWLTYFIITTNMKDFSLEENKEEVRKAFSETIEGQFEHDSHNKSFSNQIESDETDTLQQRNKRWMTVVARGGLIPNNVYDYNFDDMFGLYRKTIDPEMRDFVKRTQV